ncbi:hypothetical protein FA15DRAFT_601326 [Coprinopsis marcescibilis]|uniref:Uncharacterized protein n=1 Tax=Coprinopsis marcescibilis TaxID=230819 RepID=A0A5C3KHN9_COPMA|nr:hypothetical protein FA15DRAFT_601326 [Coprinopsis marcescibilis]
MPRKPVTKRKAVQITSNTKATLYAHAVALYQAEKEKPSLGLRGICSLVAEETSQMPDVAIILNHVTLRNLVNGGNSIQEFNQAKSWLTPAEEAEVVKALIVYGNWGIPLSYKRIEEQVNKICHARLGKKFPATGVGSHYASRLVEQNSDCLCMY